MQEARQRLTLYLQDEAKGLAKNPEREKLEREFLEKGLKFYEQLAQTNGTDWTARRERAKAYANVGLLRLELKNYVASEEACRTAVHLMEELAAEFPKVAEFRVLISRTLGDLAENLRQRERYEEAEKAYRQALAVDEELIANYPGEASYREDKAHVLWTFGRMLREARRAPEAEGAYRQALAIYEKLVADYPTENYYRREQAHTTWIFAQLLEGTGRASEAEKAYRQALALHEKLATESPGVAECAVRLSRTLGDLAGNLRQQRKDEEAEKVHCAGPWPSMRS